MQNRYVLLDKQIDLLPEEVRELREKRGIFVSAAVAGTLILFIYFALNIFLDAKIGNLKLLSSNVRLPEEFTLSNDLDSLDRVKEGLLEGHEEGFYILRDVSFCEELLKALSGSAKGKVWFNEFSINALKGQASISGNAFNVEMINSFMASLRELPFFSSVNLTIMRRPERESEGQINFRIGCELNR